MRPERPNSFSEHQILKIAGIGIVAWLILVIAIPSLPARGDEDVARIFLKTAREQVQKKYYEAALNTFQKALKAAPELPDIYFERGNMYYTIGEFGEAINDFNKAGQLLPDMDTLSAPQKEMQKKIISYQNEYLKMKEELTTIKRKYTARFMDLAEKHQDSEDDYLVRLISWLAPRVKDDETVQGRLDKITDNLFSTAKQRVFPLFNARDFDGWLGLAEEGNQVWKVEDGKVIGTPTTQGTVNRLKHSTILESEYTLYASFQLTEYHENLDATIVIADTGSSFYTYGLSKNQIALKKWTLDASSGVAAKTLAAKALPPDFDTTKWNDLMIRIDSDTALCYFNNRFQFAVKVPEEKESQFKGPPGIFIAILINESTFAFKDILYSAD